MRSVLSPLLYIRRNFAKTLPVALVIMLAATLVASVVTIVRSIDLTIYTLYGYNRYVTGITPRNALVLADEEIAKIKKATHLGALAGTHSYTLQVKTIFGKMVFPIFGLDAKPLDEIMRLCKVQLVAGRMPAEGKAEAALSADVAKNLGVKLGEILSQPASQDNFAPVPIKLVGILDGEVWLGVTSKTFVDTYSPLTWQGYLVYNSDLEKQRLMDEELTKVLDKGKARIWQFSGLVQETKSALSNLYLILNLVVGTIVVAISFVCGLLSNIYFTQRLPEIATLAAIGYPRRYLLRRAIGETFALCMLGWLMGVGLTYTFLNIVRQTLLAPKGLLLNPYDPQALLFTLPLPLVITGVALITLHVRLKRLDPVSIIERRG